MPQFKVVYNPFTGNLDYVSKDAANAIVYNVVCDPSVYTGAAIIMLGSVAYNALADSFATSNVLGIVEEKPSATSANVRLFGVSKENFVGLDETKEYYLSDTVPGGITIVPPTLPGHVIIRVGQPFSGTQLVVDKGVRIIRA